MTSTNNRRGLYGNFNNINNRELYGNFNNTKNSPVKKNTYSNRKDDYGIHMKIFFSNKRKATRPTNTKLIKKKSHIGYFNRLKKKNHITHKIRIVQHKKSIRRPLTKYYTGSKSNHRKYHNKKYNTTNIKKLLKN